MDHDDPEWWYNQLVRKLQEITPEQLEEAVATNRNLVTEFLDHDYLKIPLVEERARELLAKNWTYVQDFLKDPKNIREILMQNPKIAESGILEKPETQEYLRRIAIDAYYVLREFVFKEREKMLQILMSKPKIPLRDLLEVAPMVGVNQQMAAQIINQFEKEGLVDIIVELKRGV